MASPAAVLQILVTANTAQATTSLAKTQGQLKATAATAATASNTMGSRLATGAKYGALAMAGLGAASVKMAVDFDKSMRNVNSIAQLNEKQFAKLEDRVKSLAGRTAQSPKTLAEGLYDLVSSGFNANESMKVLASSARAATAGLTDTKTSTKAVAAVLNAYRMPAKKAADVSDTLFQTVNLGVVSFDELASTIGDVLPFASSLGVKLNEVGAAVSTMTKAGISPAETMTRLKAIMSSLLKPSEALTGALRQMGYESGEALIEQKGLQGALDALSRTTGGSKAAMAALFPNIRALGGALALTGENSKVANKDLKAFADTSGATSKALSEQSKSVAFQWNKLKAQASALAIDVGDNLIPALKDVLDILTNPKLTLDEKVRKLGTKLTQTIEEWAPKLAKAGAAVGLAIVKGIWGAFWDSDLLGKLFIGAGALRLFGGAGVFSRLGGTMATTVGGGMMAKFGAIGPGIMATLLTAGVAGLSEENLSKKWGEVLEKNAPMLRLQRDALTGTQDFLAEQLGLWKAYGHKVNDRVIWSWVENGKITAAGATRLIQSLHPLQERWRKAFAALSDQTATAGRAVKGFSVASVGWLKDFAGKGRTNLDRFTDALDPLKAALDRTGNKIDSFTDRAVDRLKDFADKADNSFDKTTGSSGKMARGIGRNVSSLANGVASGLEAIKDNLNKSLAAFQVKKVGYSVKKVGNLVGDVVGAQKGAIVGGTGSGDKVPLHINGQLAAMVEPGELVSVTNRTATAAQMALNKRIPRRQEGGLVPHLAKGGSFADHLSFALGPYDIPPIQYAADHAGGNSHVHITMDTPSWAVAIGKRMQQMGWMISENPAFGGVAPVHSATGGHYDGTAIDANTAADETRAQVAAVARLLSGGSGVAGAVAEKIARVLLKGPDGPLKDMGQRALDKARKAANTFLSRQAPSGVGPVGPGANIKGLPEALQKYNRQYPEAPAPSHLTAYHMPFNAVAALAEWAGMPGVSMARTAIGESALAPGASGIDPGGTKGLGLWMITTGFNDALIKKLGGQDAMFNPVINAQAANSIWQSQGYGAWYSQTKDTSNTHYDGPLLRKLGGLVPHLAKGGKADKPGKAGFKGGPTDPAYKRFVRAKAIADKLKNLVGERGKIARIDERIAIAETLAGQDSSELGSDLGPSERQKQIRLNQQLLARMVMARKLSRSGLHWLDFPKGMSTAALRPGQLRNLKGSFNQTLLDLTGLTGKSGRIFDTRVALDTLKHTTTATGAEAMDISGLRALIEAARYGAFDGYFAQGGTIGRGKWGIVGERGPEIVHGPATVTPSPQVVVENNFDWEGMDLYVTTKVDGQIAKREKVSRRRARQMVR